MWNEVEELVDEIRDIIGIGDPDKLDNDVFVLSSDDVADISKKLIEIVDKHSDLQSDYESKSDEVDDLQNDLDDYECSFKDIPDELGDLLANRHYDIGTVMELKEVISAVLEKRGYPIVR